MDLKTVTQSKDAVKIDESTLEQIVIHGESLENPIYWHKFLIEDVYGLQRDVVLKSLLEHVKPLDLIPLCYTEVDSGGAFFFARICGHVIEKLCKDKLCVTHPDPRKQPFRLQIVLKYTNTKEVKVDLSANVLKVLQKRLRGSTLCLNNFSEDPDLTEYFLLSQARLLAFVLNVARSLKPQALKLCNNEIKHLDAVKIMPPKSIVSLDLRNNLITDLAELKHLENFDVSELWLEGNPVCALFDERSYVQYVIMHCPKDGFILRQNGVPSFRRNFLCDVGAYDIIDRFLERYFTTYDDKNLARLESFYHDDALFSMTVLSSSSCHLRQYKWHARDFRCDQETSANLYVGRREIVDVFGKLPKSEHDPCSFTVDVLYYTANAAVIVVTGVFREIPETKKLLGFNRYFVLECRDDIFRIANEQLHLCNALMSQQVCAFKKSAVAHEMQTPTQRMQMINVFATITNLSKDWARMFLEECHYKFKHAMLLFVDLYKSDKIPSGGFKTFEQ